ncbi:MAG: hypothetical protein HQ518_28750 [Rhodopirellula sp.]|nr:hypothetical protein [Rhodopirellula sp.]
MDNGNRSKDVRVEAGSRRGIPCSDSRRKILFAAILAAVTGGLLLRINPVSADDKTKQIVGGILKILVESQVRGHGGPDRHQLRPGPPQPGQATPELIRARARASLQSFRQESITLSTLLQQESKRNVGLQSLIADAVQLQARADAISQRSKVVPHHRFILQDVQRLDSDWRRFSFRLQQIPNISPSCRASIGQLDQYDVALCETLSIEPQIDRRTLQRESEGLVVNLHTLSDDINYELRRSPSRDTLVLKTSQAHQAAIGFSDAVSAGLPYAALAASYQSFLRKWDPLVRELCKTESRFIERTVLRIQTIDQSIHELLWLPRGLDRELLIQLTRGIKTEVDRIYDSVSLSLLIQLPNYEDVPGSASDFHGTCQYFADCVEREETIENLVNAYNYLPAAWVSFSRHFRTVPHDGIRHSLTEIESRLVALREPLGIPGGFDGNGARQRAGAVERLADHLHSDIETWLRGDSKFADARKTILEHSAHFRTASRQLHAALVRDTPEAVLRGHCATIYSEWELLHRHIADCDAPDRDHVNALLIQISVELVELEAMFL